MRSPPAPDVPTSPKTIMKKSSESSRPAPPWPSSTPVSSAVIAEKLDARSQLFGLGQTAQGAHAQQALDPDPAPRTRRRSTARRSAIARPRTWLDRAVRTTTDSGRIERCSCTTTPSVARPRASSRQIRRRPILGGLFNQYEGEATA